MLLVSDGTGISEVYPTMSVSEWLKRFGAWWAPHAIGMPIKDGPRLADVWAFEFRKRK